MIDPHGRKAAATKGSRYCANGSLAEGFDGRFSSTRELDERLAARPTLRLKAIELQAHSVPTCSDPGVRIAPRATLNLIS